MQVAMKMDREQKKKKKLLLFFSPLNKYKKSKKPLVLIY
jgi:hypothetical protein